MKDAQFERLGRLQRQYHRRHQWPLSPAGLYIPHSYANIPADSLSWWADVGFLLNKRRVIVWWRHPRDVYSGMVEDQAWKEAGGEMDDHWPLEGATPNYRRLGKSRKKIVGYTSHAPTADQQRHYDRLRAIRERLRREGVEGEVAPSWTWERLSWATGIDLVVPLEVRTEEELADVARLARRLLLGQTTLAGEFPGYRYGRADWRREQDIGKAAP